MQKKNVLFNLIGSVSDKGLPIIVSAFLTRFMTPFDYGQWSLFFAFLLISYSMTGTPLLTMFARKFFSYLPEEHKMYLYFYPLLIFTFLISLLIYYSFFSNFKTASFLEPLAIIAMTFYLYLGLYFRYKGQDKQYMTHSIFRLVVFVLIIVFCLLQYGTISYLWLLIAFLACHIPSFYSCLKYLSCSKRQTIIKNDLKEYAHLTIYGSTTSMVSNVDKLIISGLGFGMGILGYYSFVYSLANIPTIIIEAFKKTMVPIMYKEWSEFNSISKKTKKYLIFIALLLFVVQFILPLITYYTLMYFNLINKVFVQPETIFYIILLSAGCYFFSLYHFINPKFFFNKKSLRLLFIQITCLAVYIIVIFLVEPLLNLKLFFSLKTALLISVTLLTYVMSRYLEKGNNK